MYTYTATIGRNVPGHEGEPMTLTMWEQFREDVTADMHRFAAESALHVECIETTYGKGVWCGVEEDSAKITMLTTAQADNPGILRRYLSESARHYGQDAIALTIGQSELIEPVRSWDVCPICGNSGSAPGWLTVHTCQS